VIKSFILLFLLLSIFSCAKTLPEAANTYIYISHPRINASDRMYEKVYNIDFSKYDMTLIGGDLAQNIFSNPKMLAHRESIFDFQNPNTLWSVGNHDRSPDSIFYKTTLKKKYHAYKHDNVTFVALNSQISKVFNVNKWRILLQL